MIPSGARGVFGFLVPVPTLPQIGGLELFLSSLSMYTRSEFCTKKRRGDKGVYLESSQVNLCLKHPLDYSRALFLTPLIELPSSHWVVILHWSTR